MFDNKGFDPKIHLGGYENAIKDLFKQRQNLFSGYEYKTFAISIDRGEITCPQNINIIINNQTLPPLAIVSSNKSNAIREKTNAQYT